MKIFAILINIALFIISLSVCGNTDFENQGGIAAVLMVPPVFCLFVLTIVYVWPGRDFANWLALLWVRKYGEEVSLGSARLSEKLKEMIEMKRQQESNFDDTDANSIGESLRDLGISSTAVSSIVDGIRAGQHRVQPKA